jgi:hypothetical protein
MLMYTVSFTLHETMAVTVHNRHPNIEVVSQVYFCNDGGHYDQSIERTNTSTIMKIGFRFGLDRLPDGILMYELQRRGNSESDHQPNTDTISAEVVKNASEVMHLSVIWKMNCSGKLKVRMTLVEHDNKLVLNKDKLAQLYNKVHDIPFEYDYFGWLMCDNIELAAKYMVMYEEGLGLKIIISKGVRTNCAMKPIWIDSTRQVSSLMVIYSMLIYIVSLTLQSAIDLTIDNVYTNIELTSLVYFVKDVRCNIQFP